MQASSEKVGTTEKNRGKQKVALSTPSEGASGLTGMWRIKKPLMDQGKCNKCLFCWLYCPEAAIIRDKENKVSINYEFCKGCGICAEVCPSKAIVIVKEV
jgi:pyruvate ferredoxin oxidoreductase delta subunit